MKDEEARGLEPVSCKKSKTLLDRQFRTWWEARKLNHLDQVTPLDLSDFRASWNNGEVTTSPQA